jgi:hypothetical protein
MAGLDANNENIKRPKSTASENNGTTVGRDLVQVQQSNISALAREHGVSRQTIRRRLANGWKPPTTISGEIIERNHDVATPATPAGHPDGRYVAVALRGWRALGRVGVGLVIAGIGTFIAYTSIRANAWFGHHLTPDPTAGDIYSNLSVSAELAACAIPTGIRFYRQNGERLSAAQGRALMAVALVVVFFAAGGFAITNINAGVEMRAERETQTMKDLRKQIEGLDTTILNLTTSIGVPGADGVIHQGECAKRGPKCEGLEAQRNEANGKRETANSKLEAERNSIRKDADPTARALGISSTNFRLAQGGAMVALCLCSGLFISFGAGLIWPRG